MGFHWVLHTNWSYDNPDLPSAAAGKGESESEGEGEGGAAAADDKVAPGDVLHAHDSGGLF